MKEPKPRTVRTICAQTEPEYQQEWRAAIEQRLRLELAHPLLTGLRFSWEWNKDQYGQDRFDYGPPDLEISASFRSYFDDWNYYEVCERLAKEEGTTVKVYYCKDEDYLQDGGSFWDDEHTFYAH